MVGVPSSFAVATDPSSGPLRSEPPLHVAEDIDLEGSQIGIPNGTDESSVGLGDEEQTRPDPLERQEKKSRAAFVRWFQYSLKAKMDEASTRRRLKKNHLLALMVILNHLDYRNRLNLTQRVLAKTIGIPESKMSVVLRDLEEMDFLTRNVGTSREFSLLVNPELFLKGALDRWHEVQSEYEELQDRRSALKSGHHSP